MDTNWLSLGGTEVVNTARAAAYAVRECGGGVVRCGCPGLAQAVEGPDFSGYTTPQADDAPWLDPAVPESGEFLGVAGAQAEGLASGTLARSPVELAGPGANIGIGRYAHREVAYTVTLIASSQAGLSYGMSWLASALDGGGAAGCFGEQACVFAWCPTSAADGDAALRLMFDVGLLEGPEMVRQRHLGAAWLAEVEFTLVAGNPFLYGRPYLTLARGDRDVVAVPPGGLVGDCPEPEPCGYDPACPPPPLPPPPPQPVDPCWPTTGFQATRTRFAVPPGGVSSWFTTVPLVRLRSREAPLRRVSVRFYANPAGADCARFTDRCQSCGEANFAYIPPSTQLDLDARRRRTVMDCSDGRGMSIAEPVPLGPGGGAFSWPEIDCASGLCVEVLWQREGADARAEVEITMSARMAAI